MHEERGIVPNGQTQQLSFYRKSIILDRMRVDSFSSIVVFVKN